MQIKLPRTWYNEKLTVITSPLVAAITAGGDVETDGGWLDVGPNVGEVDGRFDGGSLGDVVGWIEGSFFVIGVKVGETDGGWLDVGPNVGEVDGRFDGGSLGDVVGWIEGSFFVVGVKVGEKDGIVEGSYVT